MSGWQELAQVVLQLIDRHDAWAIALFVLVEEAGLPLPVPGDVAMVLAGYRVAQGELNFLSILLLLCLATFLGASLLYWLGARGGRPLLYRYGRYLHCDRTRLDHIETWLARRGLLTILLGRLIPGLRVITPLAAGAFGVPYRVFVPALMLGSTVYIVVLLLIGMWVGPQAMAVVDMLHLPLRVVLTGLTFLLLGGLLLWLYRRGLRHDRVAMPSLRRDLAPPETAALAGLLATIEMGLGVNLLLYLLSGLGVLRPQFALVGFLDQAATRLTAGSIPHVVLLLAVAMVLVNVLTALIYARVGIRALPGPPWLEGWLCALLPFLLWVLVLLPLCGAGPLGLGLGAGWWPVAGEAVRHSLFGLSLGVSHALLHQARRQPVSVAPLG